MYNQEMWLPMMYHMMHHIKCLPHDVYSFNMVQSAEFLISITLNCCARLNHSKNNCSYVLLLLLQYYYYLLFINMIIIMNIQ